MINVVIFNHFFYSVLLRWLGSETIFPKVFRIFQNGKLFYQLILFYRFFELIKFVKLKQENIFKKACVLTQRHVCWTIKKNRFS